MTTDRPMKFRKKPVVIEAMRVSKPYKHIIAWSGAGKVMDRGKVAYLIIHTLEGDMRADPGDWIIRGVQGEFYPCKPDIFAATYEEASDD